MINVIMSNCKWSLGTKKSDVSQGRCYTGKTNK